MTLTNWDRTTDEDKILLFILEKGVCYTTEIQNEVELNSDSIKIIITRLQKRKFIKKIVPKDNPQHVFQFRMLEIHELQKSHAEIIKWNWWTLSNLGIEYITTRYKDSPMSAGLIDQYLDNLEHQKI